MGNEGSQSGLGNEQEQAGSFDASGQKIWINKPTNDFIQMNSGEIDFFFGGSKKFSVTGTTLTSALNGNTTTLNNANVSAGAGFTFGLTHGGSWNPDTA